ncbi:MAG: hypothetical protein M1814_000968 [Vezdaea aestivalis]|nr:MAG: hypothetical protein M1814_000968 [Vezdaea aestivalis]
MVNRNICVSPPGPNAKWGSSGTFKPIGVNGSTVTNATVSGTFIPLIDLGSLTAITASPINTSFSTNWNGATPVRAIPTVTIANNSQNFFQQYADRTDGCPWIVGGELSDDYFELSDDCKSSLDPYCIPQLSDSTPQPTAFAPDCLPKSTASNPTASPTAAIKPSPTPTR